MDFYVKMATPDRWIITDFLGRSAGRIDQQRSGMFRLVPAEKTSHVLRDVASHTYESLNSLLRAIEIVTRGSCQLKPSDLDQA